MNFHDAQHFMRDRKIDAWLVHDFRGSNSVLAQLLPGKRFLTRRCALLVPAHGEAVILSSFIDASSFRNAGVKVDQYVSWPEYHGWLRTRLSQFQRVAMEYAPGCTLPVVSMVDAGTVEFIRAAGVEVVSSADLIQVCIARWSESALATHMKVSATTTKIMDGAWGLIRSRLAASQAVTELDVQRFILDRFAENGLETPDPPICAANAHAGDPHFEINPASPSQIHRGDFVLIDLWARSPGEENIFSDITWVGYAGPQPSARHQEVWRAVKGGRDAALKLAQDRWRNKQVAQGWELDQASIDVISGAGLGQYIKHRTGHSLSPGPKVHGMGVNIDNLETHDTRELLPGVGFTIEPGAYLPEFGIRSEINVYVDPAKGPIVTSCMQDEIVRLA